MGLTTQTYDILKRIAVGNGALVYRAVEKATMRQVALKLLVQDGDLDHRFDVDALLADSKRLRQISGTQVCQLLDAHADEDGPVLVYEYADGIPGVELPGQRKLTPAEALDVAAQLISALRSGERQKCPHGDLKPSNLVFVDLPGKRPFLLVLDWGLAAHRSALPEDSTPFLAPERLAGGAASHAGDLFSAGAILFFLYTGKLPAAGATPAALLAQLRPDLPAKLVQWVCSLLEFEPAKRPPSAVEAGAALTAMGSPPPPVPPESIRPRPAPTASGISKPPPRPVSAIRVASPASSVSQGRAVKPRRSAKSWPARPGIKIALCSGLAIAICIAAWLIFFPARDPGPALAWDERKTPAPPVPRAAAQSIGPAIGRPIPLPPIAQAPRAKPKSAARRAPAKTASKPAANPKPAVTAPEAVLIAADGFEYGPDARIQGLDGGTGWIGSWQGQPASLDGRSLAVARLPARGGSLHLPPTEAEVILSRQLGPLEKIVDSATGGVCYFACLIQHGSDLPVPGGDVQLNPFNGSDMHDLVRIVASDVGGALQLTLNNEKNPIEVKDASKPVMIVLRTTLANPKRGNWDLTAELFANPQVNAQGTIVGAQKIEFKLKYARLPKQLGLLIRKPGRTEAVTRIDEIRYVRRAVDLFSVAGK